jgi:hypothetical protein
VLRAARRSNCRPSEWSSQWLIDFTREVGAFNVHLSDAPDNVLFRNLFSLVGCKGDALGDHLVLLRQDACVAEAQDVLDSSCVGRQSLAEGRPS